MENNATNNNQETNEELEEQTTSDFEMSDEEFERLTAAIEAGDYDSLNSENTENTENNEGDENLEDTNHNNESDDFTETNDENDGSSNDTDENNDENNDGNSQENNANENNGENTDTNENNSGTSDNENTNTDNTQATGTIDPKEYEKLKNFYDKVVNTEFIANGKKVKGFDDPEKIIRSQQMAYGYSEKMKGFNEYRPYLKALKDKGLIGDESKFNFAMSLLEGDKSAVKAHIKSLNIDPVELELDESTYNGTNKNYVLSNEALILEDTLASAKEFGIEDKLRSVIGQQWDEDSFQEFIKNPEVRDDLLEHMRTGVFDSVQAKINELSILDVNGTFSRMKDTDKYRRAVEVINKENEFRQNQQVHTEVPASNRVDDLLKKQAEQDENKRKEEEYLANVKKQKEADEARRKAAQISKTKPATKTTVKKFDPLDLEGEDLDKFVDALISGKIK